MTSGDHPVLCLVGATAVGKTEVAVALARALGGEVICCDALTVYRGLSILTAKPSPPADVPHHLLDVADAWEHYDAARFAADADRLVEEIRGRGREPIVAGGTALYLKAWTKGLGPRVGRDTALRAELEALVAARGPEALVARLAARDAVRAGEIHGNDVRRLVRAIEIAETAGRAPSALRNEWNAPDRVAVRVAGLRRAPEDLARRIDARARSMFREGLAEEVARLDAGPRPPSRELEQAIGLREVREHLAGRLPLEDAVERIARATRRFARRQATFFRQFRDAAWIDVPPDEPPDATARRVLGALQR
ncbi:MAG TPA: tRNA (adenosine(37)-N6)-dimethylallyltransferase MiaA [Planctomycetota bacterium]|nr:tRNA (adenosine(37)-N6)-dimethylallyltransferase MiaA [Planctomycetota bacterium]